MSLFNVRLKNLDTELKMLEEGRILDDVDYYHDNIAILQDRFGREPLSLYQESLLKSKFPETEYLTLYNTKKTYYIFIKKPFDSLDFDFKLYKQDLEVHYKHWHINVSKDFILKCGLERNHPLFIRYVKLIQNKIDSLKNELLDLNMISNCFTSEEKLLAEVSDYE